MQYIQLDFVAY